MKKLTTALCAVLLMILVLMPGAAAAGPALSATRAYCIIDADTGLVLAQQNMNEELHPASITKVMTLALACEKAQGSWDGVKLTVSHEDVYSLAGTDSSHIALQEGEEVPLTDALYATQMASANDGVHIAVVANVELGDALIVRFVVLVKRIARLKIVVFGNVPLHTKTAREVTVSLRLVG